MPHSRVCKKCNVLRPIQEYDITDYENNIRRGTCNTCIKVCIKCNTPKSADKFYYHSTETNKKRNICIVCTQRQKKEYKKSHKELVNKLAREYYRRHKEKIKLAKKIKKENLPPPKKIRHYCKECNKMFYTTRKDSVYCKDQCKKIAKKRREYIRNEGNWEWYFNGLLHGNKERSELTTQTLIKILKKQNYKCALSNVKMTCIKRYKDSEIQWTNASIDRIIAGGEYNIDNIQLVCRAVNSFRNAVPLPEFIDWCKKVTYNAIRKQKETIQKRISTAESSRRTR